MIFSSRCHMFCCKSTWDTKHRRCGSRRADKALGRSRFTRITKEDIILKIISQFTIILIQPDGRGNIGAGLRQVSPRGQGLHRQGPGRPPQTCLPLPPSGPPPAWPRPPPPQAPTLSPPPQPALCECHRVCEVSQVAPRPPSKEAPAIWVTVRLKTRGFLHKKEEEKWWECVLGRVASEHAD